MSGHQEGREYDDLPPPQRRFPRLGPLPYPDGHCGACHTKLAYWPNGDYFCPRCTDTRREIIDGIVQPYPHEARRQACPPQEAPQIATELAAPPPAPSPPAPKPTKGKKPSGTNQPSLF